MHPFSVLTLGIFVAGYITARWDLVTRLYELAIFAWDHGVVVCPRRDLFHPDLANQRVKLRNRPEQPRDLYSYPYFSFSWFFRLTILLRERVNWYGDSMETGHE